MNAKPLDPQSEPDRPIMSIEQRESLGLYTETPVCRAEVLPGHIVYLTAWPSRWTRLWHRILLGIQWKKV